MDLEAQARDQRRSERRRRRLEKAQRQEQANPQPQQDPPGARPKSLSGGGAKVSSTAKGSFTYSGRSPSSKSGRRGGGDGGSASKGTETVSDIPERSSDISERSSNETIGNGHSAPIEEEKPSSSSSSSAEADVERGESSTMSSPPRDEDRESLSGVGSGRGGPGRGHPGRGAPGRGRGSGNSIIEQKRRLMAEQKRNLQAKLQQARAMASTPNLTDFSTKEYISPSPADGHDKGGGGGGHDAAKTQHHGLIYFFVWFVWLAGGTAFYGFAKDSNLGIFKGFFMAVNIGYSIGFGYPIETSIHYLWFSTAYVLVGSSLVAVALGFFADKIVEDADDWFTNLLQKQKYKKKIAKDQPIFTRVKAWIEYHIESVRAVGIWLGWVSIMILYSMIYFGWTFQEAQYFGVSACSTGGHWAIPEDSPDWMFGLTGFFAAFGVPIMGVAMASISKFLVSSKKELEDVKETINAPVTPQEIRMMQKFGLEDGDGEVDKAEFIVLCMCRLGTDPRVIEYIGQRFQKLDADQTGSLSMREIIGLDTLDELENEDQTESETP